MYEYDHFSKSLETNVFEEQNMWAVWDIVKQFYKDIICEYSVYIVLGSFYLCRTQQNVFSNTKKFKIQWLDMDAESKCYKFDFLDSTDVECVLTNIKMDRVARETYQLPESEKNRIEMILTKALKKEKGEPIDDIEIPVENDMDEEDDDEEDDDEGTDLLYTTLKNWGGSRDAEVRILF